MKLTKQKATVLGKACFKKYKKQFCLDTWIITTKYKRTKHKKDGTKAQVDDCLPEYEIAKITIFYNNAESIADLEATIRHELIHILLSPFTYYDCYMHEALCDNKEAFILYGELFKVANEGTVRNIEKMLDRIPNKSRS